MDKKFLNKVVNQIVRETRINYDQKRVYTPFSSPPFPFSFYNRPLFFLFSFSNHCEDVYGLNDDEIKYVWEEYKQIIKDKIDSNG